MTLKSIEVPKLFSESVVSRACEIPDNTKPEDFELFSDYSPPGYSQKRHLEFLAGRSLLRTCLEDLGIKWKPGQLLAPTAYLDPDLAITISHSGKTAWVACAPRGKVKSLGCDLENESKDRWGDSHRDRILTIDEQERWGQDKTPIVYSAKESLYKCLYPFVKQAFGFQAAEITSIEEGRFEWKLKQPLTPDFGISFSGKGSWSSQNETVWTAIELPA